MKLKKALLVVDPQVDFCPGGSLAVPEGDRIMRPLSRYIKVFSKKGLPIFVSRDWHPKNTRHFKKFGGVWPVHCVQDTKGAEFHKDLKLVKEVIILSKGMDPKEDSYSAFESRDSNGTLFENLLRIFGVDEIYIGGLATDYCVRATAIDAIKAGFKATVLMDAIKGVDLKPGDSQTAIKEMLGYGAKKTTLEKVS